MVHFKMCPMITLMDTQVLLSTLTLYSNRSDKLCVEIKCRDSECSLSSEGRSAVPRKQQSKAELTSTRNNQLDKGRAEHTHITSCCQHSKAVLSYSNMPATYISVTYLIENTIFHAYMETKTVMADAFSCFHLIKTPRFTADASVPDPETEAVW